LLAFAAAATGPDSGSAPELERAVSLEQQGKLQEATRVLAAGADRLRGASQGKLAVDCDLMRSDLSGRLGDYAAQEQAARSAATHAASSRYTSGEARAQNLIGASFLYRGDYTQALPAFQRSLQLHELAAEYESAVYRHNNIGSIHFFQGRYSEALAAYRAALAALDSHRAALWHAEAARFTEVNLAALYQRVGRDQPALDIYRKLLHGPSQLPPNEEARLLSNAGALYRRLGDPYKARDSYTRALALFRRAGDLDGQLGVAKNLAIVQALDFKDASAAERGFLQVLAAARRSGNRREELQATLYLAETHFRAGRAREAAAEWNGVRAASAAIGAPEEEWKAIYGLGRVAAAERNDSRTESLLDSAIARIEALRTEVKETPLRLQFLGDKRDVYDARIRLELSRPSPSPAQLLRVMEAAKARAFRDAKSISAQSLEALQSRLDPDEAIANVWASHDSISVLWVTRSSASLARSSGRSLKSVPAPAPKGMTHVTVIPDPASPTQPWETLDSDGRLLIERASISYMPSAYALASMTADPPTAWPWRNTLLAFADPGTATDPLALQSQTLRPLPGARAEIRAVSAALPGRALLLEGASATSKRLQDESPRWPVIHLAMHAVADTNDARRSRLILADGPLPAPSIETLRLSPGTIVVLAACDTERGQQFTGEGVQSLSRAFLSAGASSVVAAQWPVDDNATRRFMSRFYLSLADGISIAGALRNAKLESIGANVAQRDWSAFVLSGNPKTRVPTGPRLSLLLLGSAFILAGAALLSSWRGSRRRAEQGALPGRPPSA
jgi:tetratricopeptide (TPR) repeat protein